MHRCEYCNRSGNAHDQACPLASGKLDESKKMAFDAGYREGRAGKPCSNQEPDYKMGWLRGESALEAAENGCDREIY